MYKFATQPLNHTSMSDSTVKFLIGVITSWQLITLIIILLLLKPIRTLVGSINSLKVGSFQLSLQKIGESLGEPDSADLIAALNYDDLKIFLVLCGEDADFYTFVPTNITAGKFGQILGKLVANGLIEATLLQQQHTDSQIQQSAAENQMPTWRTQTTITGRKVHRALLDSIYEQMLHAKTVKK
jgi:hypothetical protein